MEGITPTIAKIAEKVDLERVAVAKAFDIDIPTTTENVSISYGRKGIISMRLSKTIRPMLELNLPPVYPIDF